MRTLPFATILLASAALSACATTYKPPVISYDDTPRKAVLTPDPPKPVRIVELPRLSPGTYTVIWHVTSVDTHKTEGNFKFTVTH